MASWNHNLPQQALNKAIPKAPDATIKDKTINYAITSKFSRDKPLYFLMDVYIF